MLCFFFFFQAEDGIRDLTVTGVQTCALPISNVDPRLPLEGGEFLPGCGVLAEAGALAARVRPIVVGKPEPPPFPIALERPGLEPTATAMGGDSAPPDIRRARALGVRGVPFPPPRG